MDTLTPLQRSALMGRIRGQDTKPEMKVRRLLHSKGYRYRLHRAGLPGRPDLVFPSRRKIIFVHGCFWHRHPGCKYAYSPKSRTAFWKQKFDRNVERDNKALDQLSEMGWDTLVVWECELKDIEIVADRMDSFLEELSKNVNAA